MEVAFIRGIPSDGCLPGNQGSTCNHLTAMSQNGCGLFFHQRVSQVKERRGDFNHQSEEIRVTIRQKRRGFAVA